MRSNVNEISNYSISCILGQKLESEKGLNLSTKSCIKLDRSTKNVTHDQIGRVNNSVLVSNGFNDKNSQSCYALENLSIPIIRDGQSIFHWSCFHQERTKRRRTKVTDAKDDKSFITHEIQQNQNISTIRLHLWNTIMNELICNKIVLSTASNNESISDNNNNNNNNNNSNNDSTNIYNNNNNNISKTICRNLPVPDYNIGQQSKVLGPNHLRKAKLMFFYTRYPSSSFLKSHFLDIRFEKTNTAQLVKWFSNFREFYYIQIEKFARQILHESKPLSDLDALLHEDLHRILVTHYNRNNQIMVPQEFASVVKVTLEEFCLAIINGKDKEQSWKKVIYKKIARLDQDTPAFFKDPCWMAKVNLDR